MVVGGRRVLRWRRGGSIGVWAERAHGVRVPERMGVCGRHERVLQAASTTSVVVVAEEKKRRKKRGAYTECMCGKVQATTQRKRKNASSRLFAIPSRSQYIDCKNKDEEYMLTWLGETCSQSARFSSVGALVAECWLGEQRATEEVAGCA